MNKKTKRAIMIAAAVVLLTAAAVIIFLVVRTNSAGYRNISIAEIFGKVITQNGGKTYEAYKNMRLADGYELTTEPDSYTRMILDDDKYVKLEQESHAVFEALGDSKRHLTTIRPEKGALTTEITKPLSETESYVVNTPNAVLAVRGTLFRIEVKLETNGDYYCDVYTYGGSVVSHRIMPDGSHVEEEIVIPAGYKATIKMDEIITVYLEERIEEVTDNIDPLNISEVTDGDLVDVYNASRNGHEMFLPTEELWKEISDRDIDLSKYKSVYDGKDIPPFNSGDINNSDSFGDLVNSPDNSNENSESSSYHSNISGSSDQSSENSSDENPSSPAFETPGGEPPTPSGSYDDNTHDVDSATRPSQSTASSPVSEPTPVESASGSSGGMSSDISNSGSSSEPAENGTSTSIDSGNSESSSNSTPPTSPVHTHTPAETRVEPTCVIDGKITRKCSVCGELLSETAIPAKGHTEKTVIEEPTCTMPGKTIVQCEVCGTEISSDPISPLGHSTETVTTLSTCTEQGKEEQVCRRCNALLGSKKLPLAEHTGVTETEGNIETVKCSVCGEIIKQTNTDTGVVYPVKVNAENFPDEVFRQYVPDNFDTDENGEAVAGGMR